MTFSSVTAKVVDLCRQHIVLIRLPFLHRQYVFLALPLDLTTKNGVQKKQNSVLAEVASLMSGKDYAVMLVAGCSYFISHVYLNENTL